MQLFPELKIPGSGNGKYKCPKAGGCLACLWKSKKASVVGLEWTRRMTEN